MKKLHKFILILFLYNSVAFACPTFYFHLNFTGTRTFHFENISNPADYLDVTGTNSIDAWKFTGTLASPCGMTFGSNICYSIYEITAHTTGDEKIAIQFNGSNPNHLTIDYNGSSRTFSVSNVGNSSAYTISWGNDTDNPPNCSSMQTCHYDYLILNNYINQYDGIVQPVVSVPGFTTVYTNSDTFIYIADSQIPSGANVTLDANPLASNGYVILDVGFETQPSSEFLAIVQTTCSQLGNNENVVDESLTIFPNPTNGILNIHSKTSISSAELFDVNGRKIVSYNPNSSDFVIDLELYTSGVYLLKISNESGINYKKIIKK